MIVLFKDFYLRIFRSYGLSKIELQINYRRSS